MDAAARLTSRAMTLAERVDLKNRLARFQIDDATCHNLRQLKLLKGDGLEPIVSKFYTYLHEFPETHAMLKGHDEDRLRRSQKVHWTRMLNCEFDRRYVHSCLLVGLAHYNAKIPPQSYIASYSFLQAEMFREIIRAHKPAELAALSVSLGKVIMLDMSISLNAYILDAMALKI